MYSAPAERHIYRRYIHNFMTKIAIIGATGLVGNEILKVLEERKVPFSELYLVASDKSKGKEIIFQLEAPKYKNSIFFIGGDLKILEMRMCDWFMSRETQEIVITPKGIKLGVKRGEFCFPFGPELNPT